MPTSQHDQQRKKEPKNSDFYLRLLPDWTPFKRPQLARFNALVKVARGAVLEEPSQMDLHLLDEAGRVVSVSTSVLDPTVGCMEGPVWRHISGRLVEVDDAVTQAEGMLAGIRSERVYRRDAIKPFMLVPIPYQLGLAREPHLWWRFYHHGAEPIHVKQIHRSTVLWLDGRALHPQFAYNGLAFLPPGRARSGLWSLDDLDPSARHGRHRFQLEILCERSEEIEFGWNIDNASADR